MARFKGIPVEEPALRPFQPGERRENEDGSHSTEITTTWQTPDGKWVNVPSLWMSADGPTQFDPDDEDGILGAMQAYESAKGQTFTRFNSVEEAEAAAQARSAAGGAGAKPRFAGVPVDAPKAPSTAPQADRPVFPMGGKGAMAAQSMIRDMGEPMPHIPEAELLSQGMSGINEGIANAMSLPATLGNAVLSVGPAVVNAVTGTDFKGADYLPDPGKPGRELMKISGAIRPPGDDVAGKVVRRVGEEVGASIPFGLSRPIATIASAVASGLGAATAQQIDPDNPWLELAGQFGGGAAAGILGAAAGSLASKSPKPKGKELSADDLHVLKNEAYQLVDGLGVKYSPQGYGKLLTQMDAAVKGKNISPTRHPKAYSLLEDFKARAGKQNSGGLTLTELDQLRQEIRRDLLQSSDMSERFYGDLMMDEVDDFINKAGAGDVLAGDAKSGDAAILAARELNTRFRKTEMIEDALYAADLKTAAASNGDVNTAIRKAFNTILLNKKKSRAFSADEIAEMEKIVKSGDGSNLLRNIGKLSADTGFKTLLHGVLASMLGPAYAAVPIAASTAKALAGGKLATKAEKLRAAIAGSAPAGPATVAPVPAPNMSVPPAVALGAAANQNERQAPVPPQYLRPTALN